MKRIAVLGSSGSVGRTALSVIERGRERFSLSIIANYNNIDLLKEQIEKFSPEEAVCINKGFYWKNGREERFDPEILSRPETYSATDIAINGIVGLAGLSPSFAVLGANCILATANKESIVAAGGILTALKEKINGKIYPLDSEHSTVWQCLQGNERSLKRIILTASGGAFRDLNLEQLKNAKAKDALMHPTWVMGKKVTVDCATLMNKGMEIIEAKHLFGCNRIDVVQHKESIIHSLVEFSDNAMLAGLSNPDMSLPVQYALDYPDRNPSALASLDLLKLKALHFAAVDEERFPCFQIAKAVSEKGDAEGTILNAANEILVEAYLKDKVKFYDIPACIERALNQFAGARIDTIEDVFRMDLEVREYTLGIIGGKIR